MNVYDALRQLEKSIKESSEHKKYQEIRAKISENEEGKKIFRDVRKKQMEVQSYLMLGQEIPEEKMKELERFNELLQFHPTLNEFLQAEYMLTKIYEDISKSIAGAFDFWLLEIEETGENNNEQD